MKYLITIFSIILTINTYSFANSKANSFEQTYLRKCSACHGTQIIDNKIKTKKEWKETVKRMKRYGMKISGREKSDVLKYLYMYRTR